MARPKRDVVRVASTVPRETVEAWREAADALGQSMSSLIAEWMTELAPGLRETARLRRAFELADQVQREKIRASVTEAGALAQETLMGAWDPVLYALEQVEAQDSEDVE